MKINRLAAFILVAALACEEEELRKYPDDFRALVDLFVEEGAKRGVDVNVKSLEVKFVTETDPPGFCGYATLTSPDSPKVQIKQDDACWTMQTEANKEILFFHELGHCLLGRGHIQDTLANGNFKSMMFSGNQFELYSANSERREYYLDELFNPGTPPPAWATRQGVSTVVFEDNINPPGQWTFSNNEGAGGQGARIDSVKTSPPSSLVIQGGAAASGFSLWSRLWTPTAVIPEGSTLVFSVKIRLDGVTNQAGGVFFAMRGDRNNRTAFFATTYNVSPINGTHDFREYKLTFRNYPANISQHFLFLMMDGRASGRVFFDDIRVTNSY